MAFDFASHADVGVTMCGTFLTKIIFGTGKFGHQNSNTVLKFHLFAIATRSGFLLTLFISERPPKQQQQFVTICKAMWSTWMFACSGFGLVVSATQYSMMELKNGVDPVIVVGVDEIALHTTVRLRH